LNPLTWFSAEKHRDPDALAWALVDFRNNPGRDSCRAIEKLINPYRSDINSKKSTNEERGKALRELIKIMAISLSLSDDVQSENDTQQPTRDTINSNAEKFIDACKFDDEKWCKEYVIFEDSEPCENEKRDIITLAQGAHDMALGNLLIDEYLSSQNVINAIEAGHRLPFPDASKNILEGQNNGLSSEEIAAIDKDENVVNGANSLEAFGYAPNEMNRKIIDMSGDQNLCGWRNILAACDSTCSGYTLAAESPLASHDAVMSKVAELRLVAAIHTMNKNITTLPHTVSGVRDVLASKFSERTHCGKSYGMFGSSGADHDDPNAMVKLYGKPIVIFSIENYVYEDGKLDEAKLTGEANASLTVNVHYTDGEHDVLIVDELGSIADDSGIKDRIATLVKDENTIVMCHVGGIHFMSMQYVPPVTAQTEQTAQQ
jgi:hypothetical protein